jgi:hypothetical protein
VTMFHPASSRRAWRDAIQKRRRLAVEEFDAGPHEAFAAECSASDTCDQKSSSRLIAKQFGYERR